jgi:hypothetical protein
VLIATVSQQSARIPCGRPPSLDRTEDAVGTG